ncbi:TPA: AlpA family phage regulatory protein [Vibrio parahaemolyticus]|nr:AlpA family phage regulatory protein [Vibrio parahaemolyticus]HAS8529897.1 AlpA family phage regulatory protein [Vibrio vulnificus]HCG7071578.1 AlpA family phage regulatory protein [Vibrio parahaemolyticus]
MRLIRLSEVLVITKLSRSTVYEYASKGLFPRRVQLGARATFWVENEVIQWVKENRGLRDFANTTRKQSLLIDQVFKG